MNANMKMSAPDGLSAPSSLPPQHHSANVCWMYEAKEKGQEFLLILSTNDIPWVPTIYLAKHQQKLLILTISGTGTFQQASVQ